MQEPACPAQPLLKRFAVEAAQPLYMGHNMSCAKGPHALTQNAGNFAVFLVHSDVFNLSNKQKH